ncbi:hypothetical protein PENTCL1PPCAC_26415, partial [Pristionchus entomophagus]
VFIWNVPSNMKWRDLHGLIHVKVIRVEEMTIHEQENSKNDSKVAILRVFSMTESGTLEKSLNEIEMSNGQRMSASVETSLYVFFVTHYSVHIPSFIRQNLRDVSMKVDETKGVIRCEFPIYGEFIRAFKTIESMIANNVKMQVYRYKKGGIKLPPPPILSLKFHSVPHRDSISDSDLVPYDPPTTREINAWVMEQDYNMWNAIHSVKYPSIHRHSMNPLDADMDGFGSQLPYRGLSMTL